MKPNSERLLTKLGFIVPVRSGYEPPDSVTGWEWMGSSDPILLLLQLVQPMSTTYIIPLNNECRLLWDNGSHFDFPKGYLFTAYEKDSGWHYRVSPDERYSINKDWLDLKNAREFKVGDRIFLFNTNACAITDKALGSIVELTHTNSYRFTFNGNPWFIEHRYLRYHYDPTIGTCSCDLSTLMTQGCQCGGT